MSQDSGTSLSQSHDVSTAPSLHKHHVPGQSLQKDATDQPGLEVVPTTDGDKQVVQPEKEVAQPGYDFK